MNDRAFQRLIASLGSLTTTQARMLREALKAEEGARASLTSIEATGSGGCVHRGSAEVMGNGTRRGLQRWLYRACGGS